MSEYKNLTVEIDDKILIVAIDRPKAMNALNRETLGELQSLVWKYWDDTNIGCVIITGAGKAFVAGADITELKDLDITGGQATAARGQRLMNSIQRFPRPVIAAVNGFALGGGCELAMACDIRFASEKAKFGQPEINLGIIPGYGGTQRLPRLVGRGKAMHLILSGAIIGAQEAHRIGLVDEVFPPDELMDKAKELARLICSKAPIAVSLAKEVVNYGIEAPLGVGCDLEKAHFGAVCGSQDKLEGMTAFLEKRSPNFKGK
jgi:enoyl-CoA hydratase